MKKVILLALIVLFTNNLNAQKKKKTKKDNSSKQLTEKTQEKIAESDFVVPTVVEYDSKEASNQVYEIYEKQVDNSTYSKNSNEFNYEDIGSGVSIVSLNNQSYENIKTGVAKDRKLILPVVFNKYYERNKPDCIILSIDNQYGVFNAITQKWILNLEYKYITKINENYLSVKKDNKYSIYNTLGEKIDDLTCDDLYSSSLPNYILITKDNKKGLYNLTTKKISIPCVYDNLSYCEACGDLFEVSENGNYNLVDVNNNLKFKNWYKELIRPNYEIPNFIAKINEKMGIINFNEEIILPFEYIKIETSAFSDGSLIAKNIQNKYGCVNIQGKTTLPFEYDTIEINYNEYNKRVFKKQDKCGLLQMNQGTPFEIATCEYESIITYKNFFIGKKNNKMIMLNNYNKPLNDLEFDSIELLNKQDYYSNNKLFLGKMKNDYYIINSNGLVLNKNPYKSIEKVGICNINNDYYNEKAENLIYKVVNEKNISFLMDYNCNPIEISTSFDEAIKLYNNNLIYRKNKKTGVLNLSNNKIIIQPEYDSISPTKNGYLASLNGNYYLINYYDQSKTVLLKK